MSTLTETTSSGVASKKRKENEDKESRKRRRIEDDGTHESREISSSPKKHRKGISASKDDLDSPKRRSKIQDEVHTISASARLPEHGSRTSHGLTRSIVSTKSPFSIQRSSLYLPLSPVSQAKPLEGLCAEHLSPQILSYLPSLRGILLSYSRPFLSNAPGAKKSSAHDAVYAKTVDEYAVSYSWLSADFLLFKPERGTHLEGYVTLQNENQLSLLCYNQFNATIERKHIPAEWKWRKQLMTDTNGSDDAHRSGSAAVEDVDGGFVDEKGSVVNGLVTFRILDFEAASGAGSHRAEGYLRIEGTLLDEEVEMKLRNGAETKATKSKTSKARK